MISAFSLAPNNLFNFLERSLLDLLHRLKMFQELCRSFFSNAFKSFDLGLNLSFASSSDDGM